MSARLRGPLILALAVILIALAGGRQRTLLRMREDYRLNQGRPLENAPPLVAFTTVAMGGFRGILADLLWVRAAQLQDEGKFFELVQLSDWIVKLEPRFTAVWGFQAWNMAYNVSVLFDNPEDRWRWIEHGITLLRNEGLVYNQGSAGLYFELGWLFQHKINAPYDNAHRAYKRIWAHRMGSLFKGSVPTPESLRPEKGRVFTDEYRMNLERVAEVQRAYGPLDWRLPQAQAIYWAAEGLDWAESDFERRSLFRMIVQSGASALQEGRLLTYDDDRWFFILPNLDIVSNALANAHKRIDMEIDRDGAGIFYTNLVGRAAGLCLYYGREEQARSLYASIGSPGGDLEAFAYEEVTQRLSELDEPRAREMIVEALVRARVFAAHGEPRWADLSDRLAQAYARRYAETAGTLVPPGAPLPDWEALEREADQTVAKAQIR